MANKENVMEQAAAEDEYSSECESDEEFEGEAKPTIVYSTRYDDDEGKYQYRYVDSDSWCISGVNISA